MFLYSLLTTPTAMLSLGILLQKHAEREKLLVRIASSEGEWAAAGTRPSTGYSRRVLARRHHAVGLPALARGRARCVRRRPARGRRHGHRRRLPGGPEFRGDLRLDLLFLRETRVKDCSKQGLVLPAASPKLQAACRFSDTRLDQLSAELRIDRSDGKPTPTRTSWRATGSRRASSAGTRRR